MGNVPMGNATNIAKELSGDIVVSCGCTKAVGFEKSAETIIRTTGLQPWPARELIKERLELQNVLVRRSVLQYISVHDAYNHFINGMAREWLPTTTTMDRRGCMSKAAFLALVRNLIETHKAAIMRSCKIIRNEDTRNGGSVLSNSSKDTSDEDLLPKIFSVLDYHGNEELTRGEIGICLVEFFSGTKEEKAEVLSELLDRDNDGRLSREELRAWISPYVWAMSPASAAALRPLLLQKGTEEIFNQVGVEKEGTVSCSDFQKWRVAHNVIDQLLVPIEGEVYKIWLAHRMKVGDAKAPKLPTSGLAKPVDPPTMKSPR